MSLNSKDKDFSNILKYYVKRQSDGENEFIADQKKSGIKVCDRISHQRSNDGKDELIIETRLSATNGSSDSSMNRTCTLIRTDNSCDKSLSSLSNSDYFIKELMVSHGKSKSLDGDPDSNIHETHLMTVVGNNNKPFETVFKAVVEHSDNGRQLLHQNSFVRDATSVPSSYNSLPGRIINSLSLPNGTEKTNGANRKKSKKSKSWRSIFPLNKKKTNADIDELAKQRVTESVVNRVEVRPLSSSMFDGDVPFKSHKIGEPLQRMKKKKMIPYFIRNILSPKSSMIKSGIWSHKDHCDINNNKLQHSVIDGSNNSQDMRGHVTRIVTTLSKDNADNEDFTYCTNGAVSEGPKQVEDRRRTESEQLSHFHFDMTISDTRTRRASCPDKACDCYVRRMDLMVKGLNVIIFRGTGTEVMKEMETYDKETFHFKDCLYHGVSVEERKQSESSSSCQSRLSLYQSCEYCNNADDQLHPEISAHLLPVINKLEHGDEINFNDDHLRFFLDAKCYKEFEEGMRQAIGFKCSIRNLAHLHYVTRKIVRHIGDPNKEDNDHIGRIMHFAERFCSEHYNSHIELYGTLEEFLKHNTEHDID